MSRIARKALEIPAGVEVKQNENELRFKGPKGEMQHNVHESVVVTIEGNSLKFSPKEGHELAKSMLGTTRVLLGNVVTGVHKGFEKKLQLVGVGYRAKLQGGSLELNLGYSHPVKYEAPEGISFEVPANTEILVKGISREKVGQVAAEIRRLRAPEPYKGKGVRYADETIILKETKKK